MNETLSALAALHQRYQTFYEQRGELPQAEYLSGWDASCYQGRPQSGMIGWRAVKQETPVNFADTEVALEMQIQDSVKSFFGGYWAGDMEVRFQDHNLTLLQLIHPEDGDRLLTNLIGHVLMKRQLNQPETLFIGLGPADDILVTVDNKSGAVGLEYVGKEQHELLASDLSSLLERAEPTRFE